MIEFLSRLVYPDPYVVIGFVLMLFLDLITGVRKAKKNNEATTSKGLRRTVDKSSTYCVLILSLLIIFNLTSLSGSDHIKLFGYSINAVIEFCVWIEFKSILENLIELNTNEQSQLIDQRKGDKAPIDFESEDDFAAFLDSQFSQV